MSHGGTRFYINVAFLCTLGVALHLCSQSGGINTLMFFCLHHSHVWHNRLTTVPVSLQDFVIFRHSTMNGWRNEACTFNPLFGCWFYITVVLQSVKLVLFEWKSTLGDRHESKHVSVHGRAAVSWLGLAVKCSAGLTLLFKHCGLWTLILDFSQQN